MTLQAIIIRADGALAETEDLRRQSFAQVFAEAGFDWSCDRECFALTAKLGAAQARMAHYVRSSLRGRPETEDFSLLIRAMHRRASKIFSELMGVSKIEPRPGMRDLIVAARGEGLRLALVAELERGDVEKLIGNVFGRGREAFDPIIAHGSNEENICERLYIDARAAVELEPRHCLVIEAGRTGASAARAAGFPVVTTRSHFLKENSTQVDGSIVVEDLPSLISKRRRHRYDPLTAEDRADLLSALQRLHSSNCEDLTDIDRSDEMRVADILKAKGSVIKTIEPNSTMRAFAHSLRKEVVGAMLVLDAKGSLQGIISERDLARGIDEFGADLPQMRVSHLMTRSVVTCAPDDSVSVVAAIMTERRIRHLPVVVDGKVVGLISIGDVLKHRLDEVQLEAKVLRDVARSRG